MQSSRDIQKFKIITKIMCVTDAKFAKHQDDDDDFKNNKLEMLVQRQHIYGED